MKLTFLGTSAAVPSRWRNVSALALQLEQRREWWLFDCGEATQHQLLRTDLSISQVRRIFISHLHGDHCFGLPGLLATRGFKGGEEPLDLFGPPGIKEFIEGILRVTRTHLSYPMQITEVKTAGVIFDDPEYLVHAFSVPHVGPTLAFVVEEKTRTGRFKVEEAKALNIPPGPLYARLKQGEKVELPDGRVIDGSTLVEPPRRGRKVALVFDTSDASAIEAAAQNADWMIHESTYLEGNADAEANAIYGHSSAAGAARLAKRINAGGLVVSHISQRYEQNEADAPTVKDLVKEAEAHFAPGRVNAAKDFLTIEVEKP